MSELARRSGLSRRYVTETEAGRANPSLLKLARLAAALSVSLGTLCDLPLSGPASRVVQDRRIALCGLRGAGKTTVGRALALALEIPLVELDERVEDTAELSLAEIFDLQGPEAFHRFEADALEEVLSEGSVVVATGGSIVDNEANFARLRETCRTVWLHAEPEDHFQRVLEQGDRRPMRNRPRALEELRGILERRSSAYALCDIKVETSGRTVEEVVAELCAACSL